MKLTIILLIFTAGLVHAEQFATTYGKIIHIRSYGAYQPERPTFIQIEGFPVRGSCAHTDMGHGDLNYFLIEPTEEHIISMVLAAYAQGTEVKITSNDDTQYKVGDICRVGYIDLKK